MWPPRPWLVKYFEQYLHFHFPSQPEVWLSLALRPGVDDSGVFLDERGRVSDYCNLEVWEFFLGVFHSSTCFHFFFWDHLSKIRLDLRRDEITSSDSDSSWFEASSTGEDWSSVCLTLFLALDFDGLDWEFLLGFLHVSQVLWAPKAFQSLNYNLVCRSLRFDSSS